MRQFYDWIVKVHLVAWMILITVLTVMYIIDKIG